MLPMLLLLAAQPNAHPITCPVSDQRFDLLAPPRANARIPTNASIWLRENLAVAEVDPPPLIRAIGRETVEVDVFRTPMRSGNLVELRPRSPLEPNEVYEVETAAVGALKFQTSGDEDRERPTTPAVTGLDPNVAFPCVGPGMLINVDHDARNEPIIYIAQGNGETYGVDLGDYIHVPVPADAELVGNVVAMDLAGNRSVPSESFVEQNTEGGCTCANGRAHPIGLLLLCAFSIVLVARRLH